MTIILYFFIVLFGVALLFAATYYTAHFMFESYLTVLRDRLYSLSLLTSEIRQDPEYEKADKLIMAMQAILSRPALIKSHLNEMQNSQDNASAPSQSSSINPDILWIEMEAMTYFSLFAPLLGLSFSRVLRSSGKSVGARFLSNREVLVRIACL